MTLDEIKRDLERDVLARGLDDSYIDRDEEREILQIALQRGLNLEASQQALRDVCAERDYVLESDVLKRIHADVLAGLGKDGKIDRREFERAVISAQVAAKNRKSDDDIRRWLVQYLDELGQHRIKTGLFRNWYWSMKKRLGLS